MDEIDLPLSTRAFETLVAAAGQAPSSHNTQPWLFARRDAAIDLLADRQRALPVNDPHDRELTISCGCALFNLRVASAAAGLASRVLARPDDADPDLLARVEFSRAGTQPPQASLFEAIARRRTYRARFAPDPIDGVTLHALVAAAVEEGATLHALETAAQREGAADLVAEGDAAQWADASWRRELAAWMHPRRRGDGLAMPLLAVPLAQAVVRTFDMGQGVGAKDRQLADASPLLAVLATPADSVADWLAAGQALQHALLAGVVKGLQASYLNQAVQVAALRPRLRALAGIDTVPQLLLRWGRPIRALPPAPRRPIADIVES